MTKLKIVAISAITTLLAFLAADICLGTTKHLECVVTDKSFTPAWTEHTTDSDGNTHSTHHDAEYRIYCKESGTDNTLVAYSTSGAYEITQIGQNTTIKIRTGRWTGICWLPHVSP